MTKTEARKLIRERVPSKYPKSTEMLLLKLVDLTYRPDSDDAERPIKTTVAVATKAARVGERQLRNIIGQLSSDGILIDVVRNPKHLACRVKYAPLFNLEVYGEKHKAEKQARNDDRAAAAREAHKQESLYREGLIVSAQLRNILEGALLDYLSQGGTLTPEQQTMLREYREMRKKAHEAARKL